MDIKNNTCKYLKTCKDISKCKQCCGYVLLSEEERRKQIKMWRKYFHPEETKKITNEGGKQ